MIVEHIWSNTTLFYRTAFLNPGILQQEFKIFFITINSDGLNQYASSQ